MKNFQNVLAGFKRMKSIKDYRIIHDRCVSLDTAVYQKAADVMEAKMLIVPLVSSYFTKNKDGLKNIVETVKKGNKVQTFEMHKVGDFFAYTFNVSLSQAKQYIAAGEAIVSGIISANDIANYKGSQDGKNGLDAWYREKSIEPVKGDDGKNVRDSSGLRLVKQIEEKPQEKETVTDIVNRLTKERTKALQAIERAKKSIAEKQARVKEINKEIDDLQKS